MKSFLMIMLNILCPTLGLLAGYYLSARFSGKGSDVLIFSFIGLSAGIVIPLYYQHKSWTAWMLFKNSLIRIVFVSLCIIIGLFVGGMIAGSIYNASHPLIMPDLDEKGAPGDGMGGVAEVWLGALYGTAIGFMVGILVPIIWGIIRPKLNNRQEAANLLPKAK